MLLSVRPALAILIDVAGLRSSVGGACGHRQQRARGRGIDKAAGHRGSSPPVEQRQLQNSASCARPRLAVASTMRPS